jgi:peptide/nickel transport system substrate-binding protein
VNRIRTILIALALLPACLVVPAGAENVVRWATPVPADSFDPYGHDLITTHWVEQQVYESLTDYDWQGWLVPGLAVSWRWLDGRTWEMDLRQGITFHDGTPFTSADVVFSIERAKADTSSFRSSLSSITAVAAVDADTVRFTAASANRIPWETDLPHFPILSKAWAERHGGALPAQLGDTRWDYVETHANGTGPFKLEEFEPGKRAVLVRNTKWWGAKQHPHNLDRIVQTRVDDPARGAQLLFAHEIDVLQYPPAGARCWRTWSMSPLYRPINAWALRADLDLPIAVSLSRPEFRDARYTRLPAK